MKILLVSSYLPYPLFSGGHIRLYNLMKQLQKQHEITLVCEKRPHQTKEDIQEVKKICKAVYTVPRNKQWSAGNILKTGFSLNPFLITGHTNPEMRQIIASLLQEEQFDIIHVETFYVMQNLPETTVPVILVEHNIEYLVYQRYADNANILLKPLFLVDIEKMKRVETQAWEKATRLVAVSEDEKRLMGRSDVAVVNNGVDINRFSFKEFEKKKYHSMARHVTMPEKELLFIGDFKWIQNRDTAKWLIQDIWPFLLRAVESEIKIKLRIVGKNIPQSLKDMNMFDSIIFDEHAPDDTALIFKQADLLLTPIRIGGGTSYKILEAMATGIPVVTTSLGREGIEAKDDQDILVADDIQTIVQKTAQVLRDEEMYKKITASARKLIEKHYNWTVIAKRLHEVYTSVKKI